MKIEEILRKKSSTLQTVTEDDTWEKALDIMFTYSIHHIPVVEELENDRKIIRGIVSDRDLRTVINTPVLFMDKESLTMEKTFFEVMKGLKTHTIKEVMTSNVVKGYPDMTVEEAIEIMRSADINALPIVKHGSELIGIVTNTDFVKLLAQILQEKKIPE
jgi:CBS domain-containing protein